MWFQRPFFLKSAELRAGLLFHVFLFLPMWADFSDLQQRLLPPTPKPRRLNSATIFCVAPYENASKSPYKYQFEWINQCWDMLKQLFPSFKLSLQSASQIRLHETKTIMPRTITADNIGEMYGSHERSQQWHQRRRKKAGEHHRVLLSNDAEFGVTCWR